MLINPNKFPSTFFLSIYLLFIPVNEEFVLCNNSEFNGTSSGPCVQFTEKEVREAIQPALNGKLIPDPTKL